MLVLDREDCLDLAYRDDAGQVKSRVDFGLWNIANYPALFGPLPCIREANDARNHTTYTYPRLAHRTSSFVLKTPVQSKGEPASIGIERAMPSPLELQTLDGRLLLVNRCNLSTKVLIELQLPHAQ